MAARNYCFTVNNPLEDVPLEFPSTVKYAVYQLECGAQGTKHYQGYMELDKPHTMTAVKKWEGVWEKAHLEKRLGTRDQARAYCMKADSRVLGPWEHGEFTGHGAGSRTDLAEVRDAILAGMSRNEVMMNYVDVLAKYPRFIDTCVQAGVKLRAKKIEDFQPRQWQEELLDVLLGEPSEREVIWVVDPVGNSGKSYLSKYMVQELGAFYCNGGKATDIVYSYGGERIAIFDYVRDSKEYVNYGVIEQVKNGMMFNAKYESCLKFCDVPHVVVFSNFEPDRSKFSADRWKVIYL